jgi:hypothetical protein
MLGGLAGGTTLLGRQAERYFVRRTGRMNYYVWRTGRKNHSIRRTGRRNYCVNRTGRKNHCLRKDMQGSRSRNHSLRNPVRRNHCGKYLYGGTPLFLEDKQLEPIF